MREALQNLIIKVNAEADLICRHINNDAVFSSEVFEDPILVTDFIDSRSTRNNPLIGKKGIYVFMVTEYVELDRHQVFAWNDIKGAGFINDLKTTIEIDDCLYLGSCVSKSLHSRIKEHFSEAGDFTALKLRSPQRNIMLDKVQVYIFRTKSNFSDQEIRIALPAIEKRLHELMVPRTGSSRT